MKYLLSLILFAISMSVFANGNTKIDSLKILIKQNSDLNNEIQKNRNEIEYTKSLVQVGNGTISNQLSSSQSTLSALSTIFSIIGILLAVAIPSVGWYITKLANRVTKNLAEANQILQTLTKLKTEVKEIEVSVSETQSLIQNNLSALYQSLQDEEITAIFRRLDDVPEDIVHFFPQFTTIKFSKNYFQNFKKIHSRVITMNERSADATIALLVQHYPVEAVNDPDLINEIMRYSFTDAFYMDELLSYHRAICNFISGKDIDLYSDLFIKSVIVVDGSKNKPEIFFENMLKIWNELLNSNHKQTIVEKIKTTNQCKSFKSLIIDWEKLILA
ncbi:hypothetical protein [Mucilaginibacter flavus]|uniref:hypothetical protein n=1 Tax=Mucilaginibacter flavus TaxID=931504 RepID=UPI0025B37897|nr:hypothetical protein [Mucilaginibacter flavus]MDN3583784.1 hypothetical protein [Mucilaginibacter flavus]